MLGRAEAEGYPRTPRPIEDVERRDVGVFLAVLSPRRDNPLSPAGGDRPLL